LTQNRWDLAGETAYTVLGVRHNADDADIAAAYRSLARVYHPDVAGESGNARMSRINAAWDRLRDPRRRDAYDRELGIFPGRRAPRQAPLRRGPRGSSQASTAQAASHPAGGRRRRDGTGGAGPPPGRPSGSVLGFGRHLGWSIGEVARVDPGYLEWLEVHREGAPYVDEIDETLVRVGYRETPRRPKPQHGGHRRWRR
jgi:DnaJ domain